MTVPGYICLCSFLLLAFGVLRGLVLLVVRKLIRLVPLNLALARKSSGRRNELELGRQ